MQKLGFLVELAPDFGPGVERSESSRSSALHAGSRALLDFWYERNRAPVMGEDLPSRRIASLLPNLAVFDYRAAREDFRVRLAGFALIRRFGQDIGHQYLADVVTHEEYDGLRASLMEARDGGLPQIREVKIRSAARPQLHLEMVLMRALAADRETPLVLGGFFFFDGRKRLVTARLC